VTVSGKNGPTTISLSAGLGADSTAGAYGATQANGTSPAMGPPASDNDNLEWGSSAATQAGTAGTSLALADPPGLADSTIQLLSVAPPASSDQALADREATPGQSGSGSVSRSLGTVGILTLPATIPGPAGWTGSLVSVSGFSATATAVAGPGATAGSTGATGTGTVSYWNGSGYTAVPLGAVGTSVAVAPVTVPAGSCTLSLTGSFQTGGSTSSTSALAGGGVATATADVAAPVVGTFTLQMTCSGGTPLLAALTLAVDLGDTSAEASFS
jgi:hypothetical protein